MFNGLIMSSVAVFVDTEMQVLLLFSFLENRVY